MNQYTLATLFLCVAATALHAQEATEAWRFSLHGGGQLIAHDTELPGLPEVPSCAPGFTDGSGNGIALGIAAERAIVPSLSAGLRVLYQTYGATLTARDQQLVSAMHDTVTATFEYTIETTHRAVGTELILGYEPLRGLRVLAGARLDVITGASFHQQEAIVSPGTIRFENDRRTRNEADGEIATTASTHLAVLAGLRYDLALDRARRLLLSPEVLAWQGLGDLDPSAPWSLRGVRFGVSASYVLFGTESASPIEPGTIEDTSVPQGGNEVRPVPGR